MSDDAMLALELRLTQLEDEREIARLVASYGPLVDTGNPAVANLWLEEGIYDVDELQMEDAAAVAAMVLSPAHQAFIAAGCAHFQGPLHVEVRGDDADAIGYSLMLVHDPDGFRVRRVTANHWQLVRTRGSWRVARRTSRKLDGAQAARDLLSRLTAIAEESSL